MVWRSTVSTDTWGGGGALGAPFFPQLTRGTASDAARMTATCFGFTAILQSGCIATLRRLMRPVGASRVSSLEAGFRVASRPPVVVTSAAYSSAASSQTKCKASMRSSLLLGSRSWRNSALTGGTTGSLVPAMHLHRGLDRRQQVAQDRQLLRVGSDRSASTRRIARRRRTRDSPPGPRPLGCTARGSRSRRSRPRVGWILR